MKTFSILLFFVSTIVTANPLQKVVDYFNTDAKEVCEKIPKSSSFLESRVGCLNLIQGNNKGFAQYLVDVCNQVSKMKNPDFIYTCMQEIQGLNRSNVSEQHAEMCTTLTKSNKIENVLKCLQARIEPYLLKYPLQNAEDGKYGNAMALLEIVDGVTQDTLSAENHRTQCIVGSKTSNVYDVAWVRSCLDNAIKRTGESNSLDQVIQSVKEKRKANQ